MNMFLQYLYLSWCKSWIEIDSLFQVVLLLLKYQITRKYFLSWTTWFHCELVRGISTESVMIGRLVWVCLS